MKKTNVKEIIAQFHAEDNSKQKQKQHNRIIKQLIQHYEKR